MYDKKLITKRKQCSQKYTSKIYQAIYQYTPFWADIGCYKEDQNICLLWFIRSTNHTFSS